MRELAGDIQHVHDPVLALSGGKWHVFSTGNGIPYRVSDDGIHWKYVKEIFTSLPAWHKELVPGTRNPWAPDISFWSGRWRLLYSVSTFGSQRSAIGMASCEKLGGEGWRDDGPIFSSQRGDPYNAIDPNIFVEKDGTPWLSFGSFWQGIFLLKLDPKTGKPASEPKCIAARPGSTAIEAPFITKRAGWYYLFVSHDFCCRGVNSTYKSVVGRSKKLEGPYVDRDGKALLTGGGTIVSQSQGRWRGPGHCAVVGDTFLCHSYDAQHEGIPTLFMSSLRWDSRGWPALKDTEKKTKWSDVIGDWEHQPDGGAATMLQLKADGSTSAPGGTWTREGQTITLRWPAEQAPGGAWLDKLTMAGDLSRYEGKNQQGQAIHGTRVA
jgi:arabinan endo-1,5-alpha-L-arabinosidase